MFVINNNDSFIKVYKAAKSRGNLNYYLCVCLYHDVVVKAKGQKVADWFYVSFYSNMILGSEYDCKL